MRYTHKRRIADHKEMKKHQPIVTMPVFKIFKEGSTNNGPVTILRDVCKPYDVEKKKAFYTYLGFKVLPL